MFWRWFISDRAVTEALEQSRGYNISPDASAMQAPANTDTPPAEKPELTLWTDYEYNKAEEKFTSKRWGEPWMPWQRKKKASQQD